MSEDLTIEASSEDIAAEIGIGILLRARQIHHNQLGDTDDVAEELSDIGKELIQEYE